MLKITFTLHDPAAFDLACDWMFDFMGQKREGDGTARRWIYQNQDTGIVGNVGYTRTGGYSVITSFDANVKEAEETP